MLNLCLHSYGVCLIDSFASTILFGLLFLLVHCFFELASIQLAQLSKSSDTMIEMEMARGIVTVSMWSDGAGAQLVQVQPRHL